MSIYVLRFNPDESHYPYREFELEATNESDAIWESFLKQIDYRNHGMDIFAMMNYSIELSKVLGTIGSETYEKVYAGNFQTYKFNAIQKEIIHNQLMRNLYSPDELEVAFKEATHYMFPSEYAIYRCIYNKLVNEKFPSTAIAVSDDSRYMMMFDIMNTLGDRDEKDYRTIDKQTNYTIHLLIKPFESDRFTVREIKEITNAFAFWEAANKIANFAIEELKSDTIICSFSNVAILSIVHNMHIWFNRHNVECSFSGVGMSNRYDFVEFHIKDATSEPFTYQFIPNTSSMSMLERYFDTELHESLCNYYDKDM